MNAPAQLRMGPARKEIGFGAPPWMFDPNTAVALAKILAAPTSRGIVAESAQWDIVFPITDAQVAATFGKVLAPFSTPDSQPPAGVFNSSNTLAAPQMPSSDMVIFGLRTRVLVEPESRLIRGNVFNPTGVTSAPGSPDVFSSNDFTNNTMGPGGEGPSQAQMGYIPAELLWGTPTWRFGYNLIKAYQVDWKMSNQDSLLKEPLLSFGTVEPFAEAMAAGTSFTSNIDRIAVFNARMQTVGLATPLIFEPITHKRLGSFSKGGATNLGDFTPTREEDGSPTVYGGIGVPNDEGMNTPYQFPVPIFWPSGQPFSLQLSALDGGSASLAEMQRWLSVTGGSNGVAGSDLALAPWATPPGPALVSPGFTVTGAGIMDEVTLDPVDGLGVPASVSQGSPLMRFLGKGGVAVLQQDILGIRITQPWKKAVFDAINAGAIQAPMGTGNLGAAT